MATGIARLRYELDKRPKLIEKAFSDQEEAKISTKQTPMTFRKLNPRRVEELTNFDTKFTRMLDKIDRQLRTT